MQNWLCVTIYQKSKTGHLFHNFHILQDSALLSLFSVCFQRAAHAAHCSDMTQRRQGISFCSNFEMYTYKRYFLLFCIHFIFYYLFLNIAVPPAFVNMFPDISTIFEYFFFFLISFFSFIVYILNSFLYTKKFLQDINPGGTSLHCFTHFSFFIAENSYDHYAPNSHTRHMEIGSTYAIRSRQINIAPRNGIAAFEIFSIFVALQLLQVYSLSPSVVTVGDFVILPSSHMCCVAAISFCSTITASHAEQ